MPDPKKAQDTTISFQVAAAGPETPATQGVTWAELLRWLLAQQWGRHLLLGLLVVIILLVGCGGYAVVKLIDQRRSDVPDVAASPADLTGSDNGVGEKDRVAATVPPVRVVVPEELRDKPEEGGEREIKAKPLPPPLVRVKNPVVSDAISIFSADAPEGSLNDAAVAFARLPRNQQRWFVRRMTAEVDAFGKAVQASQGKFAALYPYRRAGFIYTNGIQEHATVQGRLAAAKSELRKEADTANMIIVVEAVKLAAEFLDAANRSWFADCQPITAPDFAELRPNPAYLEWKRKSGG
jgi:hypothetical protein